MPKIEPVIYILASRRNGTLYVGVTANLIDRISIHKQDLVEGFAKRYGVHVLVYYEEHPDMLTAIAREKQVKKWPRAKKIALIERDNPTWRDLYFEVSGLIDPATVKRFV